MATDLRFVEQHSSNFKPDDCIKHVKMGDSGWRIREIFLNYPAWISEALQYLYRFACQYPNSPNMHAASDRGMT